ncbi:MAG: zinc ribbon domain-containing protein [Acidobacteria bacterium]|nr:MAG: zinc ribbon domain-containing protein [Acidobacteriota bacterium]
MPLYEYRCDACGHRFEQIQKFSDPAVEVCPNCGERNVQKLLSSPAIQFKGSGWYITDYARKGTAATETASKPADSDTKDTKSASPDSKSSTASSASTDTAPAAKKP